MENNPDTRKQLIAFARSQMVRRGEIDTLIFTTKDIMAGLRRASENLDKTVTNANQAIHSIGEGAQDD